MRIQRIGQRLLGAIPVLVAAHARIGSRGQAVNDLLKAEIGIHLVKKIDKPRHLALDRVLGAENMPVVLGKAAHAHNAVQRSRGFVAVTTAELRQAQRQVPVRAQALIEHLDVAGTVHGLNGVIALFGPEPEHVLAKLIGVARLLPQRHRDHLGRLDFAIPVAALLAAHILFDGLVHEPAVGVPEHHARGLFLGVKQVEFFTDLAVVALFRLLYAVEVLLELFLVGPGGAVDALQHLIAGIAAPVGAGQFGQLVGAEPARARHMGPATQIHPVALAVDGNLLVLGQVANNPHLVLFAERGKRRRGLFALHDDALDGQVRRDDLRHARFDPGQVLGGKLMPTRKIVVKTFVDYRPDGHLRARIQILYGHGEQVRRGVADNVHTRLVALGDNGQTGVAVDGKAGIDLAAIDHAAEGGAGQTGADIGGDLEDRNGLGKLALTAVRQSDKRHVHFLVSGGPHDRPREKRRAAGIAP